MQHISPKLPLSQRCTNPMYQLAVATKFDTLAPNVTGSTVVQLAYVPRPPFWRQEILKWLLDFWKCIWTPLRYYRYAPHNDVSANDATHIGRWSHAIIVL